MAEAYDAHTVYQAFQRNRGVYGVRKLWHTMRREGRVMGRDQVGRLMEICGITGVVRGKHRTSTTQRDDRAPRHPDLVDRQWSLPSRPDQWWVADFTYCWTLSGFVYTAFLVDVYSRRILAAAMRLAGTRPPAKAIRRGLGTGLRGNVVDRVVAEFTPESVGLYADRSGNHVWSGPRGFLFTTQDKQIPLGLQRNFAHRLGGQWSEELATGSPLA